MGGLKKLRISCNCFEVTAVFPSCSFFTWKFRWRFSTTSSGISDFNVYADGQSSIKSAINSTCTSSTVALVGVVGVTATKYVSWPGSRLIAACGKNCGSVFLLQELVLLKHLDILGFQIRHRNINRNLSLCCIHVMFLSQFRIGHQKKF